MGKIKTLTALVLITLISANSYSQDLNNDTIRLQNLNIKAKEPKTITIKKGKGKKKISNGLFKTVPEAAYLIEEIPYGKIQEITLHFAWMDMNVSEDHTPIAKIDATTYEMTFFEVKNNMLGPAVNEFPIIIQLPASKINSPTVKINLKHLNLNTDRLFVVLRRKSALPRNNCNIYIPVNYISEKQLCFQGDIKSIILKEKNTPVQYPNFHLGLYCKIKTATRYY